ncbi:Quinone oxidoreductase [Bienertia sinuspersici]
MESSTTRVLLQLHNHRHHKITHHFNLSRELTRHFNCQINPLNTISNSVFKPISIINQPISSHKTLFPYSPSATKFQVRASSNSPATAAIPTTVTMVKAIRVHELGGAEVLKWEDVEVGEPKEGEIRVRNKAIGLNFIDIYFRKGVYKAPTMPFTPGMEAVGEVVAVGPGLTGRQVGDLVAYAGSPMGSYAEEQVLPANRVVPLPPSVDPITAASVMLKGMTVHYLVRRSFKVEAGHTVLVHAAAGGVGSLLCQWANALGATVIGTVSTKEKALQAIEDGCHHVIIYKEEDFVSRVKEITGGQGVEVVYDSVGKDTFQGSLDCLKLRGYMVLYGQSSGTVDHIPLSALAVKSLFITRPTLMHYTTTRDELLEAAGELFANIASGVLRVHVNHKFLLSQAAEAQTALENRQMTGSVVLIPDASL